jgi:hypothetical protein
MFSNGFSFVFALFFGKPDTDYGSFTGTDIQVKFVQAFVPCFRVHSPALPFTTELLMPSFT